MAIPSFENLISPLLQFASDEKEHSLNEAVEFLAQQFNLSDSERTEISSSGRHRKLDNRVSWARTYLKRANFIEYTGRGKFRITELGLKAINDKPPSIDVSYLRSFFPSKSEPPSSDIENAYAKLPQLQDLMLPILDIVGDGLEHSLTEVSQLLMQRFGLHEDARTSGRSKFKARVAWAKTYLKRAGLVEYTRQGHFKISAQGIEVLEQKPESISIYYFASGDYQLQKGSRNS